MCTPREWDPKGRGRAFVPAVAELKVHRPEAHAEGEVHGEADPEDADVAHVDEHHAVHQHGELARR